MDIAYLPASIHWFVLKYLNLIIKVNKLFIRFNSCGVRCQIVAQNYWEQLEIVNNQKQRRLRSHSLININDVITSKWIDAGLKVLLQMDLHNFFFGILCIHFNIGRISSDCDDTAQQTKRKRCHGQKLWTVAGFNSGYLV